MVDVKLTREVYTQFNEEINAVRNLCINGTPTADDLFTSFQKGSTILETLCEMGRELSCVLNTYTATPHEVSFHWLYERRTIIAPTLNDTATDRRYSRLKYKHYIVDNGEDEGDIYRNLTAEKEYAAQINDLKEDLKKLTSTTMDIMVYLTLYVEEHMEILRDNVLLSSYIEYKTKCKAAELVCEMCEHILGHITRTYSVIKSGSLRKAEKIRYGQRNQRRNSNGNRRK